MRYALISEGKAEDDHNLVRTHAQYRLLQSMEEHYGQMCRIVAGIAEHYRNA